MFCPLIATLIAVLLSCSLSLSDLIASSPELMVHMGDSALLGCKFQSTEEKPLIKVDWLFSSGEHAKNEYVMYYYSNLSVSVGRFKNRARLVGDILRSDGSLLLENVQEADRGNFSCEIRRQGENVVVKKKVQVHVLPEMLREFEVHVGDSAQMGCVFHSTEKKQMTEVRWTFSSGQGAKEESVLHYDYKFNKPMGYPQGQGRFQNRVALVGDTFHNDASIVLQRVKVSDQGNYTCSIYLGNVVFRKTVTLQAIQKDSRSTSGPEGLGGNQLVIIVGIICTTLLLLPVLILIVKRSHRNTSSVNSSAMVKNLEKTGMDTPEKHIYFSVPPWDVGEEEPSGQSEATYMTMYPILPSLRSDPNNSLEKKSSARTLKTEPTF
ncbi:PREDICTED: junctional adhesion molecule-like [Dipodomys ordii]|uniref:Junctional adhesion molecule-like n=1 Tax=Dipodomys ordii TaxID=10020 RepID=A0A1S3EMS3_DIPOR|nr:PREDICTED: junctional adhesion molecule-like [Dipodomys ordii]XP_012865255.1 PREDICTED: junctional adhesion molecule-like [Dipodomys ordii]